MACWGIVAILYLEFNLCLMIDCTMGPPLNKMGNNYFSPHFHFHFLICLVFPEIPLVKTTKNSKIYICIFQIQISPWRAALRKKLFWTFLLQISQLKTDQNFTLLRPPLQHFPQKNHKKIQKNYICFSLVKIWAVLHHLKKEWILFTMKWARNEFLHLWISKMSIDMGKRIVQWLPTILFVKNSFTFDIF